MSRTARWSLLAVVLSSSPALAHARAPGPAPDWAQAQAAERRTLQAERDALTESLRQAKANAASARASLRKEVEALTAELTRLQVRNAQLERDLPARERVRTEAAEQAHLTDLIARMRARLGPEDAERLGSEPEHLPGLIEAIFADVEAGGELRAERDAEFFGGDGVLTRGTILRIGQVGALRWDPPGAPLVATPEGLREAIGVEPRDERRGSGVIASAVLYEPDDPPEPGRYAKRGWRAKMDAGGPIMWVLLLLALGAALVIVERTVGLLWAARRWRFEERRFEQAVNEKKTSALLDVGGWIAKPLVIAAAARCPSCATPLDTDVEERATQALMVMRERLQRRLSLVNVAAGVAPLLGLLGTVTGMIHTFSVVTSTGTSEPQQLAAGISEALLTTQFGLVIAIPAFLAHALLSRGARRILASAEQSVLWYLHGAGVLIEPAGVDHGHVHTGPHRVVHHHHHQPPDADDEAGEHES